METDMRYLKRALRDLKQIKALVEDAILSIKLTEGDIECDVREAEAKQKKASKKE
jgi:hypothetical protein